jgi:hypothetical protein
MTLTGCIAKGADGMFTLTNVQADSSASTPSATGTAGAAGAAPSSAAGAAGASATWNLRGSDLATHVGHRVQVTGKPAAAASTSGATSGAPGATTATNPDAASRSAAGSSASSARTLEVSAVKMVAATCP